MLCIYSYLVKDNPVFALTQRLYVGIGIGYGAALAMKNVVQFGVKPLTEGNGKVLIPIVIGLLAYLRWVKPVAWVSRIPASFVVALGAALTLRGTIQAQFIDQIRGTMLPLVSFNNLIIVFGTASTLLYFFFRDRQKSPLNTVLNYSNKFARYIMMVALGIAYTGNLSANIPRTIGQLQLIFGEWIHLIPGF
jgi:hypothetical protein